MDIDSILADIHPRYIPRLSRRDLDIRPGRAGKLQGAARRTGAPIYKAMLRRYFITSIRLSFTQPVVPEKSTFHQ